MYSLTCDITTTININYVVNALLKKTVTYFTGVGYVSAPPIRRGRFGAAVSALDISAPDISAPELFGAGTFFFRFVVL